MTTVRMLRRIVSLSPKPMNIMETVHKAMEETTERNGFTPIKLPPTGPRPHRCEVCQRSFREIATLRKHEQLHRADRPYVCTTCSKSFLWSSNLKVHERVHTGERPYKCKICHRCFTQSNDLRRHERNVHMRGKLYGYKNAGRPNTHVNLAAYQAFALQQRAILQQALTYESFMQNAAAATQMGAFHPHQQAMLQKQQQQQQQQQQQHETSMSTSMTSRHGAERTTSSPIKLEQVTPPSTPSEIEHEARNGLEKRSLSTTSPHTSDSLQSPQPSYTPSAGALIQSPPLLMAASAPPMTYGKDDYPMSLQVRRASESSYSPFPYGNGNLSPPSYSSTQENLPHHQLAIRAAAEERRRHEAQQHHKTSSSSTSSSCDVMDLSMGGSGGSKTSEQHKDLDGSDSEVKASNGEDMPPPKTPSVESECGDKRDVTTTSASPTADSGIHHCEHCNIFFYDFTMFHLHQSLHSPYEEHPFSCPSCQKRCQDRIEFMFHIVWHVKYPNTIPNYQPFKESYLPS